MLERLGWLLADLRLGVGMVAGDLIRGEQRTNLPQADCTEEHADERPLRDWWHANGWAGVREVASILLDALPIPGRNRPTF